MRYANSGWELLELRLLKRRFVCLYHQIIGEYLLREISRNLRSPAFFIGKQLLISAVPDMIDTKTQEIKAADKETYTDMRDIGDELPDSSPRFVLLSYPLTLVSHDLCNPPCV